MGSPNFRTANIILNMGLEFDESDDNDYDQDYRDEMYNEIKAKIEDLPRMHFHQVVLEYGYHSGFQLILEELIPESYVDDCMGDLYKYNECSLPSGYTFEIQDLDHAPRRAVNITRRNLKIAINGEMKEAFNAVLAIAEEFGLGQVHGLNYTSSVGEVTAKPFR